MAHDNFDRIIAASQDPNSVLNKLRFVEIGGEELESLTQVITSPNNVAQQLAREQAEVDAVQQPEVKQQRQNVVDAKRILIQVLSKFNSHPAVKKVEDCTKAEVKPDVMQAFKKEVYANHQTNLFAEAIIEEAEAVYTTLVPTTKKILLKYRG